MKQKGTVIIPDGIKPYPEPHEIRVAEILAAQGKSVMFVRPNTAYKAKTYDIIIDGVQWEIKSPLGNSRKNTIIKQLKRGQKQSLNIIIDATRTKLDDVMIEKQIRASFEDHKTIRQVIMITKHKQVIVISK
jgi:hypothetical protein